MAGIGVARTPPEGQITHFRGGGLRGRKRYEIANHLGNVLAVCSDRKIVVASTSDTTLFDYYLADLYAVQDYHPFGMQIPERSAEAEGVRFGFNGKEKDGEWHGSSGQSYDFGARMYDPNTGRWRSGDPKGEKYPYLSPYTAFGNSPIFYSDPGGETLRVTITAQVASDWATQRVIGTLYQNVQVPVYKAYATDSDDNSFKMEFYVTRDAWVNVNNGSDEIEINSTLHVVNAAFEPQSSNTSFILVLREGNEYPPGSGSGARALRVLNSDGSDGLAAESYNYVDKLGGRGAPNKARGVLFHVGGYYEKNANTPNSEVVPGSSLGCFGIVNTYNSEFFPSNQETNNVISKLIEQSKKTSDGRIDLTIEKRENSPNYVKEQIIDTDDDDIRIPKKVTPN